MVAIRNHNLNLAMPVNTADPVNRHHPLNRGKVAWWMVLPGLDGGRQLYDLMGLYHGTLTNMTTAAWRGTTCPGHMGEIVADGANDYIPVGTLAGMGTTNWTISCWAKSSIAPARNDIVIAVGTDGNGYAICFGGSDTDNSLIYILLGGVAWVSTGFTFSANTWYHIMAARVGSTMTMMVNGRQTATAATTPITPTGTSSLIWQNNGASGANALRGLTGSLASADVWSRGLSASEMAQYYFASCAGYPGMLNRVEFPFPEAGSSWFPWTRRSDLLLKGL